MLLAWILAGSALAAPALVVEAPADLPAALGVWESALNEVGLSTRPTRASLLADDHPLLPNAVTLAFSGTAVLGLREGRVNGAVTIERVAPGQSRVTLEFTPGPTPRDEAIQPRLVKKLNHRTAGRVGDDTSVLAQTDPLLVDPARCAARVKAFADSPFPGADGVLIAHLDALPAGCRRPAITALLPSPEGKAAVSAWLVRSYDAATDADKATLMPLIFQVPDPPPELEAVLQREEARQDAAP